MRPAFMNHELHRAIQADGSRAHIFVAALGASSYTFACATPREGMADWLHGCSRALSFFGGVPQCAALASWYELGRIAS